MRIGSPAIPVGRGWTEQHAKDDLENELWRMAAEADAAESMRLA